MTELALPILIFIFGTAIGSFLNVVIHRLPRDKSIVRPGSACTGCGAAIRWYDNVPIIGYLVLRGRCRDCGAKISPRYPLVELLTGIVFYLVYRECGLSFALGVNLVFSALLIAISFIDLDFRIIPDILSVGGMAVGLALAGLHSLILSTYEPFLDSLIGVLLGGGILWAIAFFYELLRKREGMGGGDIKLLAMIGSFCGIKGVIFSLVAGSMAGTIVGIPLMLIKGEGTKYALPFGPFLSFGALLYVLIGQVLTNAVFGILAPR